MVISFTDREMKRAWESNLSAFSSLSLPTNSHRLLLFYAVECGLKTLLMKRRQVSSSDQVEEILSSKHDLNKLLDHLKAGSALRLPHQLQLTNIKIQGKEFERKCSSGEINQIWRYGGSSCKNHSDQQIEKALLEIVKWIQEQL
jgi:hypothetical protein